MRLAPTHVRLFATVGTAAVLASGMIAAAAPASAADCAAVDCTARFQGGGVQTSPTNWLVRWGSEVGAEQWNVAQRFFTDVDGAGYLAGLTQYSPSSSARVTTVATFGGTVGMTPATTTSTTLTDSDIVNELRNDIDSNDIGHDLPSASSTTNYFLMLPPGTTVTDPAGNPSTCGYHSSALAPDGATPIRYAVLPDMSSDAAHASCFGGSVASSPTGNAITGMMSNFLVGMITNPSGTWSGATGWVSAAGEIGDTCTPAPSGRIDGFVVHPYWSNALRACTFGTSSVHFTSPPPAWTTSTVVTAVFSDTDAWGGTASFTCALDAATPKACRPDTTLSWSGLVTGTHMLTVRGTDGGHTLRAATAKFIVDTTKPTATMNVLPRFTTASSVRVSWLAKDTGTGVQSSDVRTRSATATTGFGSFTYAPNGLAVIGSSLTVSGLVPGSEYCFSVRPTDVAQHVGSWSGEQCVTRILDDRVLTRSKGWGAGASTHQYAGTYLKTTKKRAALVLKSFTGSHVALLVNTCAKCGSVDVFVGSKLLKTVSLVSKTTKVSVQIVLPGFARTSAPVKLVTKSTGIVVVDGLGVART